MTLQDIAVNDDDRYFYRQGRSEKLSEGCADVCIYSAAHGGGSGGGGSVDEKHGL